MTVTFCTCHLLEEGAEEQIWVQLDQVRLLQSQSFSAAQYWLENFLLSGTRLRCDYMNAEPGTAKKRLCPTAGSTCCSIHANAQKRKHLLQSGLGVQDADPGF